MSDFNDFNNPQVAALPRHLKQFIVDQHYGHYTPVDHAVWRYVMRQNYSYLKDVAYYPYIPGLQKAGLTIEKIPDLQDMNNALAKIGWGAVTVDGFIPPAAFMEYQAYRVLVIAADIRQLKHIEYTPAPDIIHESAGHAPIIADKDYHEYLSYFGSIGAKAMFSAQDFELYEAIRALSILKEMPDADEAEIKKADELVSWHQDNMGEPSEMALLSRLHWWTVEYGLIGTLQEPKIYGAGLLSSIGESASCMLDEVKKLPYTIDAVNYSYDITKTQPQLFVTPTFQNLIDVLEQFADTMSFRRGGAYGLQKAIDSKNTCTAVYSSGLQVSGTFTEFKADESGNPTFIKTTGEAALAVGNKQLKGHGKNYHQDGFSSPVGRLKGFDKPLEDFTADDLKAAGIETGNEISLTFESGVTLSGKVSKISAESNKIVLIKVEKCTVLGEKRRVLFDPSWGVYDMAVGEKITSVYCGAADKDAFLEIAYKSSTGTHHLDYDHNTRELHKLYQQVRNRRHTGGDLGFLGNVWRMLQKFHHGDWLCALEIMELLDHEDAEPNLAEEIRQFLENKAINEPEYKKLISDGLYLIKHPVEEKLIV
ncbi:MULTISPECIES: aromatic amino acid hydroxylase [unclassified Mucilaginibacter]|uniref:aromatic amino acid hydroxylase n=1 Tax=unclassified Mucilaginibacter TaxID=2617802 RepID=UPI002AC9C8F9|nr:MULTISPECIES: aromatic amino acid hydroxylase [unclassified Mucilaginibacter]MEB0262386.1 aromatic amino acid hydroxylase [Mucilaginibacter sp. 10I4]MEB0277957.1 aromatic amino acid hydroxylase [Mucilaginibacter sp. 10B2]MEB0299690.1 aromatic amino acid hydroxylase [Mucilaginibacter sp. 5C4]WPX22848.1 aromatic amino acid hydroxylase [Mucilaginibacter sp. 5C4]